MPQLGSAQNLYSSARAGKFQLGLITYTLAQRQKLTRKIRTRSFAQYLPFAMMVIQFSSMKGAFQKPRFKMKILGIYQMLSYKKK